jgi:hypothetical protein
MLARRPETNMSRRGVIVAFGLLGTLLGSACEVETKTVTMRIDHFRDPCWGPGPDFCLRVVDSSDPELELPREIAGFEHEWGHVYELQVRVQTFGFGAESSEAHHELLEIASREPVPADVTFELPLTGDFIARVGGQRFDLVGGLSAECGDESICATVAHALRTDAGFTVALGYVTSPGPLVAHSVVMTDE